MLHSKHRRGNLILQICALQHPQDPAVPHEGSTPAPVPSACQLHLDYSNSVLAGLPDSAIKPLQRIQNAAACLLPFDPPLQGLPLAPCSRLHQFQDDDGTSLQDSQLHCPCLFPSIGQTTHPSSSSPLNWGGRTSGTYIT